MAQFIELGSELNTSRFLGQAETDAQLRRVVALGCIPNQGAVSRTVLPLAALFAVVPGIN
jgi:hypothetical protein